MRLSSISARLVYQYSIFGALLCAVSMPVDGQWKSEKFELGSAFEEEGSGASARYLWRSSGTMVFLTTGGVVRWGAGGKVRIRFLGANPQSQPRGELPSKLQTRAYRGPERAWRTTTHFNRVRYSEIYPGIDLVFVTGNRIEYNFEIAPKANPGVIRIRYEGTTVHLTRDGDLELRSGGTVVRQERPSAFQEGADGRKTAVMCHYRVIGDYEAALGVGPYDGLRALFVDPVLDFSTYLGGSGYDAVNAMATDAQGNVYLAGETSSGSLTTSSYQPRTNRDAFVAKFSATGSLLFAVYLGGSQYDSARGLALDALGNVYVTGVTDSSDFAVTSGALSTNAPGVQDAFVAKFNVDFALQYSTYLGGGSSDSGLAIAVDSAGNAYITGQTASPGFPVTRSAPQTVNQGGPSDCFISKLNFSGSALVYSTFLGGSALDLCTGIAVDASGNAYVSGTTHSRDFPVNGALQSTLVGTTAGFVTKLNATGSALVYSTYLGGSVIDNATAIAVDSSGEAYISGDSASFDFPTTAGVVQNQLNGLYNAFVCKLSAAGNALVYSTFLGGSGSDAATSLALDAAGRAIIGGYTSSANFPTAGAIQSVVQGSFDAFAAVLSPTGTTLVFSTYLGGAGDDRAYAVAAAPNNVLYLGGVTSSSNFPVASPIQPALSVTPDGFVLQISYVGGLPSAATPTPSSGSGGSRAFVLPYSDTAGASDLQSVGVWFDTNTTNETNSCLLSYNSQANQVSLLNDSGTSGQAGRPGTLGLLQNSQCEVNLSSTSVAISGNSLTLTLGIIFKPAFAGAKNIYLYALDDSGTNSGWQQQGTWTVPSSAVEIRSDFSGGGHQDIVWQNPASGASMVFDLGGPQGTTLSGVASIGGANTWRIVAVADFNGDGHPDLVWQDPNTGKTQIWFMGGVDGTTVQGTSILTLANPWRIVAASDFNRDGHPDLVWQDPATGHAQIWFLGGTQGITLIGAANLTNSNSWHIVGASDFNGDGQPDLLWQDPASGATQVWQLDGAQGNIVSGAAVLATRSTWHIVAVADLNLDGHPDAVWQDPVTGTSQVWFLGGEQGTTLLGAAGLTGANAWHIVAPR